MLYDVIRQWGGKEVTAQEVYTDIFKLGYGYIQKYKGASNNRIANPLAYWKSNDKQHGHYRVMFEDTFFDTLQELQQADFAIINGITYFGRRNVQDHASKMFCMIFDLDGVTDKTLNAFFSGAYAKDFDIYPLPNYVCLSGHGVHLYYVFEEPIPLYPNIKTQLKAFKYALIDKMWNAYTSELDAKQYQGINQGFRVIGGNTKIPGAKVRAFQFNTHPFTLSDMGRYILEQYQVDESKLYKESKLTLEQAKEKYPVWYEKVVEGKNKSRKKWDIAEKVNGNNPYALYDWWKKQIEKGATYHHRYFDIMCLAIYGVKTGVPYEQVRKDAYAYIPFMNQVEPSEKFTRADVKSALECYDDRYATFPIDDIEKITDIRIEKNKRNGQKQADHLEEARAIRDIRQKRQGKKWTDGNGRKPKKDIVEQWQAEHPNGIKADCIRELRIDRKTVSKYWHE